MTRRVAFLIFPDFQLLDAAGPISAFEIAERYRPGSYESRSDRAAGGRGREHLRGHDECGGLRPAHGRRHADHRRRRRHARRGAGTAHPEVRRRLRRRGAPRRQRLFGRLRPGGHRNARWPPATTHWTRSRDFARRFPRVKLDADRIFIKSGKFWSSAGITAGIDLSLALIAEDLGEAVARKVAQQLVVYYRRPGGQSQFSTLLELERADGRFAPLLDHVRSNLRERLSVEELAAKACMSPRNFARVFQAETGTSPASAVMRLRAETARAQIESGGASVQEIARDCGFGDPERMRRAFVSLFGRPPSAWIR